jgi:hypothetical protein
MRLLTVRQENAKLRFAWQYECLEQKVACRQIQEVDEGTNFKCVGTNVALESLCLSVPYVVDWSYPGTVPVPQQGTGCASGACHERATAKRRKARIDARREKEEHFCNKPIGDLLPAESGTLAEQRKRTKLKESEIAGK